jgi:hypothetical protein
MKPVRLFILIIFLLILLSFTERPARSADQHQGDTWTNVIDLDRFDRQAAQNQEPGFPVQTWHDAGPYTRSAVNIRAGNIDSDPELEILVSGTAQGPLYAFNYDGTPVPGWPVIYYDRSHVTTLGNLSNQSPGLEIFTGQFVYRVPMTPPGPMMAVLGNGSFMPGWPKDSVIDIRGPAILADVNGDYLDEIFINEGDFLLHAYSIDGTPLVGWPQESDDPSYAIADLDKDGDLEIVTVINSSSDGADLVAYHHDGTRVDNFLVRYQPYRLHCSPVIGDIDDDGYNEVILYSFIETDPYFALFVIGPGGQMERQIPLYGLNEGLGGPSMSLALADMDGDRVPEIIIGCGSGILVFQGDGNILQGFPVQWGNPSTYDILFNAPMIGDIDADGLADIVMTTSRVAGNTPGQVYVYNSSGQLNPHFPKDLEIGFGGVPAIADIDLDGRNEILITGSYWEGFPGFFDKVWVYDLGGLDHGKVEWGQEGGGPQNWGLYPAPPTNPGIDLYVSAPGMVGSESGQSIDILDHYGNLGVPMAYSVTMTATLETGLVYLSDTSGITPTINGQIIVWDLPDLGFSMERQFELTLQLPPDSTYGDSYTLGFSISARQLDADPSNNSISITIKVAKQIYMSIIRR